MDWWVIEYDNQKFDSHKFLKNVQDELGPLFIAAGGGPAGAGVFHPVNSSQDGRERLYFNSKAAAVGGVPELLSKYHAKKCSEPSEFCGVFVGNHAEPLNSPLPRT
jgi:hypothetical protein